MRNKIARSAALLGIANFIGRFCDVIALVILARFLTPADFGLVAAASSIVLITSSLTQLPTTDALIRRKSLERQDLDTAFTLGFARGAFLCFILSIAARPIALFYGDPRLEMIIYAISTTQLFTNSPAMVHFARQLDYAPNAKISMYGKVAGVLLSLVIAILTQSYWALVLGMVTAPLVTAIASFIMAPHLPRPTLAGWRAISSFVGWMSVTQALVMMNQQSDRLFIGKILGKTSLGYYSTGADLSSVATYALSTPLMQPIYAGFSRLDGNIEHLRKAYLKSQQALAMVVLPFGIGTAAIAHSLIPLMLGPGWEPVILIVMWLAPTIALHAVALPVQPVVLALGQPRLFAIREMIQLCSRLPLTVLAAWQYGLIGATIARAISSIAFVYMNITIVTKLIGLSTLQQIINVWRSIVSCLVMWGCIYLLEQEVGGNVLGVIVLVSAGVVIYGGCHLALWVISGRTEGAESFFLEMGRGGVAKIRQRLHR